MIIKLLGIIDILAAVFFWLFSIFEILPSFVMFFAFIILAKGIFFLISEHIASVLDIIIAGIMFLSLSFALPKIIVFVAVLFLIQKGILSLL